MVKESGIGKVQLDRSLEGTGACEGAGEWEGIARYGSGMSAKAWKGRGAGRCKSVGGTRSWEWEGAARHGPGIEQESGKVQEPRRGHNLGRVQEPGRADNAAVDYGKWFIARLRLLDSVLSDGREYLCAGRFTLADICVVFALLLGVTFGFDKEYKPQTKAYLKRITARPAFEAADEHEKKSAKEFLAAQKNAKL